MTRSDRQGLASVTLVLGGTRSGKSRIAESLAAGLARSWAPGPAQAAAVTYIATARLASDDPDHLARIEAHRARRPESWSTLECRDAGDLTDHLARTSGVVLVDSLGTWLTLDPELRLDLAALVGALGSRAAPTVVVSEEVGLAIHPTTELGRRYVDALGEVNQAIAAIADRALLVVAGRVAELDAWEPG